MTAALPLVAVLLSTCNGERWLDAQIESLARQRAVRLQVLARDDGSTDGTAARLEGWAARWDALTVIGGGRMGAGASFLDLLVSAPGGCDAYAFCDQDDVWFEDKLARATAALAGRPGPALYCSAALITDETLRVRGRTGPPASATFEGLLFENFVAGNTVVMNAPAQRALTARLRPAGSILHDWWCALAVAHLGEIIVDPEPGLFYRQHRRNLIGVEAARWRQMATQARRLVRERRRFWPVRVQAAAFLAAFGDTLGAERRALVERLARSGDSLGARLRYAAAGPVLRRRPLDALAGRALMAAGWT